MSDSPKLSIIVPVYNVEEYLSECLDSILSQTLSDIEVLVIDDGSTDSSAKIIQDYEHKDQRIKAYFKINGGLSDTRNYGLDRINGQFVTFVDSDDVLLDKGIFNKIISIFNIKQDIDIIQYDVIYKWNSPYEHKRHYPLSDYHKKNDILEGYLNEKIHVSCCDKIFRSEIFNDIRFPKGEISEDIAIIPQIVSKANGIYTSEVGSYGYRYREGSISTAIPKPQKIYSILRSYNKFINFCLKYNSVKRRAMQVYTDLIWNYTSIMRTHYQEEVLDYLKQPVFIKFVFKDWLKNRDVGLLRNIKSFLVCVCGVRVTFKLQRFFIK